MDTGKQKRYEILLDDLKRHVGKLAETHHWTVEIDKSFYEGEYLIARLSRGNIKKNIACLYSSATANKVYKHLDEIVDLIIINSNSFYRLESFAYGIETEIITRDDFITFLRTWNNQSQSDDIVMEASQKPEYKPYKPLNYIQSEQPLKQIWFHLKQYRSSSISKTLIRERIRKSGVDIEEDIIESKANGLSFCLQNAFEYFQNPSNQNMSQRIINYYYGIISFASAEMLSDPDGANSLDEIESMTKYGHGLYTFMKDEGNKFESLIVGVLASGFYKNWMDFLGNDTKDYPKSKPKKESDLKVRESCSSSLLELFSRIPELESVFHKVANNPFGWIDLSYDNEANPYGEINRNESYVILNNPSGHLSIEDIKSLPFGFTQIQYHVSEDPGLHFRVCVKHPDVKYWHQKLPIHHSPFIPGRLILPLFGDVYQYKAIITALFYALSIIVRYLPSIWRNVNNGEHEKYLVVIESLLEISERVLPEIFLQSIMGEKIFVTQPGSMFAVS